MRRAVRDYRYEINEPRMTDECNQYLAQLQKDWERHRVKIGVEALRKEVRSLISATGVRAHSGRRSGSANATEKKGLVSRLLSTMFPLAMAGHHRHHPKRRTLHSVTSMHCLIGHGKSPPGSQPEHPIPWASCSTQDTCCLCSSRPTRECLAHYRLTDLRRTRRNVT